MDETIKERETYQHAAETETPTNEDVSNDSFFDDTQDVSSAEAQLKEAQDNLKRVQGRAAKEKHKAREQLQAYDQKIADLEKKLESASAVQAQMDNFIMDQAGFKGDAEKELIKKYSSMFGGIQSAMSDPVVLAQVTKLRQQRETEETSVAQTNDGSAAVSDTDKAYEKFKRTGELPTGDSPEARKARIQIAEKERMRLKAGF